ncbi:hypothetical protein WNY97_14485 [Pseudoalteromonas fuliginea]|uniref:hypothetical protein n=1 Tax=Pseudoalteromonas TaxID=53246 RepID=UPI00023164FC|nr:hypothetical protein [Pseudoalteromonas sp. BSi20495]GAA77947.1 hypothetical protein P20495_0437 [Pseudoalteromonas sp. BSi20495]
MTEQPHVGLSLVNKAPLGMLVTAIVAVLANALFSLNLITLGHAIAGGILCGALLLAYWLGKGGLFFVLGVSTPLILVLFTPIAKSAALLNLVSGFFFGFCLVLVIYRFLPIKSER